MRLALLSLVLMACAGTARENQADTYRMRINEVTDRLTPMRDRVATMCHTRGLPEGVYNWCARVEHAFDFIADSQRVAWAAVDAYELGTLANEQVENAIAAIESAMLELDGLGHQPPSVPP